MAFYIPNVKDVVQRARNAFRTEMPGSDAWLWPNNVVVAAKVIGGAVWEVFGKLAWMDKQRFALTATGYELERHGLDYGINRKPASFAYGSVVAYADYPYTVQTGTKFYRTDGAAFTSTKDVDVGRNGFAVVPVVSDVVGVVGNTLPGAPLTSDDSSIATSLVDDFGIGQGANTETDDQLRDRILARKRYPPMGGAAYDYVAWAKELPGVTRVFPAGNAYGRGTVGVWFLMDDTYPAGIPMASDVAAVQAYIDTVAPVTASVFVQAPIADCIDIVVKGLNPDTQAVREAVGAELASLFRKMAQPGLPDDPFILRQSWLWQAVGNASGERSHQVVAPASDLTFGVGVMPCLRSVKFIP